MKLGLLTFIAGLALLSPSSANAQDRAVSLEFAPAVGPDAPVLSSPTILMYTPSSLSSAAVVGFATLGAAAGAVSFGMSTVVNEGVNPLLLPSLVAGGAAVGGMTGALIGRRRMAPLWTILGAALGALPLAVAQEGDRSTEWLMVPALVLPALGAWIGNSMSQ